MLCADLEILFYKRGRMAGGRKTKNSRTAETEASMALEHALIEVTEYLQAMMRETAQRSDENKDVKALADTMEKFSRASTRLLSLLLAQLELSLQEGKSAQLQSSLDAVLHDLRKEE